MLAAGRRQVVGLSFSPDSLLVAVATRGPTGQGSVGRRGRGARRHAPPAKRARRASAVRRFRRLPFDFAVWQGLLELLDASSRDVGIDKIQRLKLMHTFEMRQPLVGHLSIGKV